ncbi:hypothetical protein [uncultured Sneathiella sp.]|uniref:hypothetical protein n=1 Tax=uncultured Sneathiella sp. TaxID=879315 RepID=UPI0030D9E9F9
MSEITYASVKVGDVIPALTKDEITRITLGLFAGASGDHNPIHIDGLPCADTHKLGAADRVAELCSPVHRDYAPKRQD